MSAVIVTAVRVDPRSAGAVSVEVDGQRVATVSVTVADRLGLKRGHSLSAGQLEQLLEEAAVEAAYRVAVRILAARPRARRDLLRRLTERGHEPSLVERAVARLESAGVVDDDEFARHFVRVRAPRGYGPSRLLTDLLARGVDRRVSERAVAEVSHAEGTDSETMARSLAEKRARQLGSLATKRKQQRLLAYLARRGYRGRAVREMVAEIVSD